MEARLLSLGEGKHVEVAIELEGQPLSLRPVSKRLLFFQLRCRDGALLECIAKDRDGFLNEADVIALTHALDTRVDQSEPVRLVAFPEVGPELAHCLVMHVREIEWAGERSAPTKFPRCASHSVPAVTGDPCTRPAQMTPSASPAGRYLTREPWKRSGNRVRPNNETRHQQFVEFLIETYGIEHLRSGAGVLDVAGGAGGVAFEVRSQRRACCSIFPSVCT